MKEQKIGMVVPTYNEAENLGLLVTQLLATKLPSDTALKLVIVDDNSPDGTGAIADNLQAKFRDQIEVVHRLSERGRASAGIAGFRAALADASITHIGEMDADFSHAPSDLPSLVDATSAADVVIGSRYIHGSRTVNCPLMNKLLSRAINLMNRMVLGISIKDSSGGYKIYARKVMASINLDDYSAKAYSVGIETLLKCRGKGFTFVEVPITFRNRERGNSKMDFGVMAEYPRNILRLKLRDMRGEFRN